MKKQVNWNILKNFRGKDSAEIFAEWLIIDMMISFIFYRSIIAFLIIMPGLIPFWKKSMKRKEEDRRKELAGQFRESIMAVSTALNAGYSIENAFVEAFHDMSQMYGADAMITREYRIMTERLKNNETLEKILNDFAKKSGIEDVSDFSDVFCAAKRSGGDMVKIIRRAAGNISDKIEVKREIETMMSAKKFEQRIMEIVPFGIIGYLGVASPGFLDILYHNIPGIAVMTFCLALYAGGFLMAEKIIDIEI